MHIPIAITGLAWAVVAYIIYSIISSILISRSNAAKAKALKCEEPFHQPNKWPLGIDQIKRVLAADNAKLFPVDAIQRTVENGTITFKYNILGVEQIATHDEKNIQAILATQFADFDLGPVRRGNFFPLLGNGIFTEDGKPWEHSRAMMRPQFARGE